MKIYLPGSRGVHTIYVRPGVEHKNSDFLKADGTPEQFAVVFREGVAEVPDNLGRYMIDSELAARSPLLLPAGVTA